jgi:hypothetical protein
VENRQLMKKQLLQNWKYFSSNAASLCLKLPELRHATQFTFPNHKVWSLVKFKIPPTFNFYCSLDVKFQNSLNAA